VAATEPITINVDPEVARAFNSASPEEREQLELLINLQLIAATRQLPPLEELMDEIGRKAQERGLTPEILEDILRDA
jgi:hemoglobin-like flavoprotein